MAERTDFDVVIAGGGAAGLSAALVLGRCLRRVLVCDAGRPRNTGSKALHCFLSRDGERPSEFLRLSREQLTPYANVVLRRAEVTGVNPNGSGFGVILQDGERVSSRKVLLATGVRDNLPDIAGMDRFWGNGAYSCPYCDAWEFRGQPIAVHGEGSKAAGFSRMMRQWTDDIVLCSDGSHGLDGDAERALAEAGIRIVEKRLTALDGGDGGLERLIFEDGQTLDRKALFMADGLRQRSHLFKTLNCAEDDKGGIATDPLTEETSVPGVYAAGDASRDVLLLIVAAAEAVKAATAINNALLREDGVI